MIQNIEIPHREDITELVRKIKQGETSVEDVVREHINLAKEIQKKTNAFITIFDGETNTEQYDPISEARKIDEKIKSGDVNDMKLLGVPFTAKDLFLVKNTRTTFSTQFMSDFIAPYTGTVIQRCLDEGAILIAKCNCDPFGFGGSGENSGFGAAKNPYDLDRSPGGSSSGSAASLAAGVGFFSLGTDTGGSVRQPAAMCGLYGFKPRYGSNSRFGISSMGSSFDTPGFFTRYWNDIDLLQEIMQGKDQNDATTYDSEFEPLLNPENEDKKLRIGLPKEYFTEGLDHEIKSAIDRKLNEYGEKGHEIVEVSIPSLEYSLPVYYILVPAEISANKSRYDGIRFGPKVSGDYETNLIESRSQYFEKELKRRIMIGTYVLQAGFADQYYNKASKLRAKIIKEFNKVFESVDIIVTPTSPTTAFKLGEKTEDPVQMYLSDIYTVAANVTGVPAINIPAGKDSNGLPIGMQLIFK